MRFVAAWAVSRSVPAMTFLLQRGLRWLRVVCAMHLPRTLRPSAVAWTATVSAPAIARLPVKVELMIASWPCIAKIAPPRPAPPPPAPLAPPVPVPPPKPPKPPLPAPRTRPRHPPSPSLRQASRPATSVAPGRGTRSCSSADWRDPRPRRRRNFGDDSDRSIEPRHRSSPEGRGRIVAAHPSAARKPR
jgi:hypothetical protein